MSDINVKVDPLDLPFYSPQQPTTFDGGMKYYEQLLCLRASFIELKNEVSGFNDKLIQLGEEFSKELADAVNELNLKIQTIEDKLYWLATGGMYYDISSGYYRSSVDTARRMWQFDNPLCLTVEQMGKHTAAEIGTQTCGHIANQGKYVFGYSPDFKVAEQHGWACAKFNPKDYIRRDELEYVEVENLEQHTIMGINEKNAATEAPTYPQYIRQGTVEDLAGLQILWNEHMVTKDYVKETK